MINVFDLSAGMAGTKLLTEKVHRDDSPVRKIRADVKKSPAITPNLPEDCLVLSDLIRNSPKRHKGTPMKALLDKEMSKEIEPKRKQTSVVAKLMGLEDPNPSIQCTANPSPPRRNSTDNCTNTHKTQGPNRKSPLARHARHSFDEILEYKDVYEVQCQGVPNGKILDSGRDIRMDLVRRKFTEAKRLATDERLLHSHEFHNVLDVLNSNRDLFLKCLEEPKSLFSIPPPPQTKRITVLKPVKSFENSMTVSKQIKRQELVDHNPNRRLDNFSQPTRIVVLKPSPNPIRTDEVGSARNSWHRRDESLISSICSNGYRGDDSSLYDQSDNGYLEEDATGTGGFSESEAASPLSHKSWGYATGIKLGSPFSASSFSQDMYSPESSVIKEAKKRLSERWAMVTSDDVNTVPVTVPRSSSTLGEMLATQELKKEKEIIAQERSLSIDRERDDVSSTGLSRSKSLPVSSSLFKNLNLNSSSKPIEVDKGNNNKGKSFFKGKVSNFFFNRSKKPGKVKVGTGSEVLDHTDPLSITSTHTSSVSNVEIEEECGTSIGALFKHGLSIENPHTNESLEKLLRPTRDQPSPTSVLDVTFDETSGTEPDSFHPSSTSYQQPPLSRSSAIESVARTLSWDEKCSTTPNKAPDFLRTISIVNKEEQELYSFVEKLLASSGFDTPRTYTILSRWHSLDSPLNPTLLDKVLDPKEEAAKCRERRSNQRLLFDCVNMALLQIGNYVLKNSYPWSNHHKVLQDGLLISEVWRLVRDFFCNEGKFVLEERENPNLIVERVVKKEIGERNWTESMQIEVDEISKEIGGFVLDDLVGETLAEFAIL
ncbi:methyl-coenzyme M reductase II subunit gamma, putative (DUF3741) [Carex rostrata]